MVGTALVYTVLWLCVALGVIVTGVVWLDAAPDAAPMLSLWFWGFIALAVVGLIIAPFFLANRWHAASLNGRGYEEVATVRAKNPQRAVKRVVELAA